MSGRYDHQAIERKWQKIWADQQIYRTPEDSNARKRYVLDMFPYPSGAGLHVGHPLGYIGTDIVARYLRTKGYNVLHPMGFDAFGLPAEDYAIKTGVHPAETTELAVSRYREQLDIIGLAYDWDRMVVTSRPDYYRWTQWLFLQLYKKGLAYRREASVNWCPHCQTVLANEQVKDGTCERCNTEVIQRQLKQWFFKITQYANELLSDVEQLDWPESIKAMQRNWIGRSEGAVVKFQLSELQYDMDVFTTRPDTLYGVTYVVLAPEHPLIGTLQSVMTNHDEVVAYVEATGRKTELERKAESKEQSGVELKGVRAIHPLTQESLPIWIADYVLMGYGTGAIMAVPAHDERDAGFADQHGLLSKRVVESASSADHGLIVNSQSWDSLHSFNDREKIIRTLVERGVGKPEVQYRMRDWLVSRQRYWGAPIPIVYCKEHGEQPVPEDQLPVLLPTDVDFRPTGESPLTRSGSFHASATCPQCNQAARREVDTMDTFVDSSWYYLRYADPQNSVAAFDQEKVDHWLPVDWYVGGAEHAVLHLLYARFLTKALADAGLLTFREPFLRLRNQGMIGGEDGRKMSKRWGNVVNPDDVVHDHGADALRAYEMFMGPFGDSKPWDTRSILGVRRWLDRIWDLQERVAEGTIDTAEIQSQLERTVRKVTHDIELFKFNTAISALMEMTNSFAEQVTISTERYHRFLQVLAPFAPHIAEELYELTGGNDSIQTVAWPEVDEALATQSTITLPVQVNGKTRTTLEVAPDISQMDVVALAQANEAVTRHVANQTIIKVLYVPGKVLNLVVAPRNQE